MEASSQQAPTSDDLFDVSVEVRLTCRGVPGPDPAATAQQMVVRALEVNRSLDFTIVDVGEANVSDEGTPAPDQPWPGGKPPVGS